MNKKIKTILPVVCAIFIFATLLVFALPVSAATTVSLSPAIINVSVGQTFNVVVNIDPKGASDFVEKISLNYPTDILEVKSFSFGDKWMALTQPEYDVNDTVNGILTKSAGYPSGFSSATTFGTVSFITKKAGNGSIIIGNSSIAFQANSQTAIVGSGTSVNVAYATVVPVTTKTTVKATPKVTLIATTTNIEPTLKASSTQATTSLTASVSESIKNNAVKWVVVLAVLLVIVSASFAGYVMVQKGKGY
ncbi:MAG: cohesin domain-containing protein [Candidatus Paceibacterota bacterium]|jgi:hypothetical protein